MKKKTLALFLAATLIAGSLAGCGSKKTNEPQKNLQNKKRLRKKNQNKAKKDI